MENSSGGLLVENDDGMENNSDGLWTEDNSGCLQTENDGHGHQMEYYNCRMTVLDSGQQRQWWGSGKERVWSGGGQ